MKKLFAIFATATFTSAMAATAFAATPDVYVVNFRNEKNAQSQALDTQLLPALSMLSGAAEHVVIDTTTAARWEKGAHEAFDRNIVPVFNQWVGLPGFAAIVDARSKKVIGCVNAKFQAVEIAEEIKKMSARTSGKAYFSQTSSGSKSTACPAAFNQPPE